MDIEGYRGQEQDLPGMPKKFKISDLKIPDKKPITRKEMEEIWDEKQAEKIEKSWLFSYFVPDRRNRIGDPPEDEIYLDRNGVFRVNGKRRIDEKEVLELITERFKGEDIDKIMKKIEKVKKEYKLS